MRFEPKASNASSLHRKVLGLLRDLYPQYTVHENHPVHVPSQRNPLFVDLLVKELNVAIECHGRQHFEYVEHFHGSRAGFSASVERDRAKAQAIREAGFGYVMIRHDEVEKLTKRKLLNKLLEAIKERP